MILPPPLSILIAVDVMAPGIWSLFIRAANAGLGPGDVVTSWWRDPQRNQEVGGHPESQHLVGLAFDVATVSPPHLAMRFRSLGFTTVEAPRYVHVQTFAAGVLRRSGILEVLGLRRV